jgi:hypothetical protein
MIEERHNNPAMNNIHETYKKVLSLNRVWRYARLYLLIVHCKLKTLVSDHVNLAFKKFVLEGLPDMVSLTHQEAVMESYILSKCQTLQEGNRRQYAK